MRPTEQLKDEHEAIKSMLDILEKVCQRLESGQKVNPEHLDQIVDFIRTFADSCHHGKEEDLLFPAMEEAGVPKEGGPIGVMLLEHDAGRNYVKAMSDGITEYKQGNPQAPAKIVQNARDYITLLRQHIDKENTILYPIGEMHLPPAKETELLAQFEKVEEERIGPGRHEAFHQLLHSLGDTYL